MAGGVSRNREIGVPGFVVGFGQVQPSGVPLQRFLLGWLWLATKLVAQNRGALGPAEPVTRVWGFTPGAPPFHPEAWRWRVMGDMDAATVRGLMDGFPAVDLPFGWIGFVGFLIAAGVVVVLVAVAWIAVYVHRRKARRRVQKTKYFPRLPLLPRHALIKEAAQQQQWWKLGRQVKPAPPRYPGMGTDGQRQREERQLLAELDRIDRSTPAPGLLPLQHPFRGSR